MKTGILAFTLAFAIAAPATPAAAQLKPYTDYVLSDRDSEELFGVCASSFSTPC